ncbi:Pentatricopeptide repeat-containing protein At1g03100, mitochondrial [Linum perenne]
MLKRGGTRTRSWLLQNWQLLVIVLFVVVIPLIIFFPEPAQRKKDILHTDHHSPTVEFRNGTDIIWQIPSSPKAVLFLAHGCNGRAANFWDKSPSCANCIGLPEERLLVLNALARNFAVLAISSRERCWTFREEMLIVKEIIEWWVLKNKLDKVPLVALGASSGGYFISALATNIKFSSITIMIAEGVFSEMDIPEDYPPTLFVHMPKDVYRQQKITTFMEMLKSKGIDVAEVECLDLPLSRSFLAERVAGLDASVSAKLFDLFKDKGFIDEKGYINKDGRATRWKDAVRRSGIPLDEKLFQHVQEELNLAFAYHEMTSLPSEDILKWSETTAVGGSGSCSHALLLPPSGHKTHTPPPPIPIFKEPLLEARDPAKLSEDIETALDDLRFSDAWKLFNQHMQMEGFPRKSLLSKLLTSFAQSLDLQWIDKAYSLIEQAIAESKQTLLEKEPMIYLSLSLAKCGSPVAASTLIRKLIEMEQYPPVSAWSAVLAHMSLTPPGAYLAAELILEIGYLFQDGRIDPRKKSNVPLIAMRPDTTSLNIALTGCFLSGTTRKAEQLLDMMPRVGVRVNASLLITMAHIYERNGRREELRKLQRHIDEAPNLTDAQFRQFNNCLLTCHLKFGDLESASEMVLKMLQKAKKAQNSLAMATFHFPGDKNPSSNGQVSQESLDHKELDVLGSCLNTIISYQDFCKDRYFLKLQAEAKEMLETLLAKLQMQVELITTEHGILQPTEKIYVKLVKAYLEAGKIKELATFLINAEKEDSPASNDDSAIVHVINSCISLGWLDQAHDLLDEMRMNGFRASSSVYASLLKAYCKENRARDAKALLQEARRAGVQLDSSSYEALMASQVLEKDTQGALHLFKEMKDAKLPRGGHQKFEMLVKGCAENREAGLMAKLLREIHEGQTVDSGVHDWNNVIHFFSKKRLMNDAEKALKKMRSLGYTPNAETFHSMVTGYAAVGGKYIEVTELWGEMKSIASATSSMKFDQELLDSVLYTFVRGGFFTRANEVVDVMEKGKMFIDKYKYRTLFLKYHKTIYKGKAPKFQTESQMNKRDAALSFKKWLGLG